MTHRSIGGTLDVAALAALSGRDRHRPQTREQLHVAVVEMAGRGMTDYGIAAATGLAVEQVRRMIGEWP